MESGRPQEAGERDGLPSQSYLDIEAFGYGPQDYDHLIVNGQAILQRLIEENPPGTTPHETARDMLGRLATGTAPDDYFI